MTRVINMETSVRLMSIDTARLIRDGGIEAMDALNAILDEALPRLSGSEEKELRLAIARTISAILDNIVNPALREHPQLEVDEDSWGAIAVARSKERLAAKD